MTSITDPAEFVSDLLGVPLTAEHLRGIRQHLTMKSPVETFDFDEPNYRVVEPTDEPKDRVVELIAEPGMTLSKAAVAAGVGDTTPYGWYRNDPDFARRVDQARRPEGIVIPEMTRNRPTLQQCAEVLESYDSGKKTVQVHIETGLGLRTVQRVLRANGRDVKRSSPMTAEVRNRIIRLARTGATKRQIAYETGHSYNSIRKVVEPEGLWRDGEVAR